MTFTYTIEMNNEVRTILGINAYIKVLTEGGEVTRLGYVETAKYGEEYINSAYSSHEYVQLDAAINARCTELVIELSAQAEDSDLEIECGCQEDGCPLCMHAGEQDEGFNAAPDSTPVDAAMDAICSWQMAEHNGPCGGEDGPCWMCEERAITEEARNQGSAVAEVEQEGDNFPNFPVILPCGTYPPGGICFKCGAATNNNASFVCAGCFKKQWVDQPTTAPAPSFHEKAQAAIGLIEGRHALPVSEYLLSADVTDRAGFHQSLFDVAFGAAQQAASRGSLKAVDLYATGLTVAVLGAVAGFQESGVTVTFMSFDRDSGQYERVAL